MKRILSVLFAAAATVAAAPVQATPLYAYAFASRYCDMRAVGVAPSQALKVAMRYVVRNSIYRESMAADDVATTPKGHGMASVYMAIATNSRCPQFKINDPDSSI